MNGKALAGVQRAANEKTGLCSETQGRAIVAAIVNEAVEEALGIGIAGESSLQPDESARKPQSRPAASRK